MEHVCTKVNAWPKYIIHKFDAQIDDAQFAVLLEHLCLGALEYVVQATPLFVGKNNVVLNWRHIQSGVLIDVFITDTSICISGPDRLMYEVANMLSATINGGIESGS